MRHLGLQRASHEPERRTPMRLEVAVSRRAGSESGAPAKFMAPMRVQICRSRLRMSESTARDEALAFMRELERRPAHVEDVARLADQLFGQLFDLHGPGPRERLVLEAAALLHDLGQGHDPL